MHGRIRPAIVQTEFIGPGRDVVRTLLVVLATAPVGRCVSAQVGRSVCPVSLSAPFRVRDNKNIVRVASPPVQHTNGRMLAISDSTGSASII